MNLPLKPMTGRAIVRLDKPDTVSATGLVALPDKRAYSAEIEQERNHHPAPPPAVTSTVEAIGPWPIVRGKYRIPDFGVGARVALRAGCGRDLRRFGAGFERLKDVGTEDVLAVVVS